jgi:hypothetical protein
VSKHLHGFRNACGASSNREALQFTSGTLLRWSAITQSGLVDTPLSVQQSVVPIITPLVGCVDPLLCVVQLAEPNEDELVVKDQSTLIAALRAARASLKGTRPGPELGTFLADTLSPLPPSAPLLVYQLPAACSGVMPLLVQMTVGLSSRPAVALAAPPPAAADKGKDKGGKKGSKGKGSEAAQQQQQQQPSPGEDAGVVLVTVSYTVPQELGAAPTGEQGVCCALIPCPEAYPPACIPSYP